MDARRKRRLAVLIALLVLVALIGVGFIEAASLGLLGAPERHEGPVYAIAFIGDSVVSVSEKELKVWDLGSALRRRVGPRRASLRLSLADERAPAIARDRLVVATLCLTSSPHIEWRDLETGSVRVVSLSDTPVNAWALSADGRTLALARRDGAVAITSNTTSPLSWSEPGGHVAQIAWSPRGRLAVVRRFTDDSDFIAKEVTRLALHELDGRVRDMPLDTSTDVAFEDDALLYHWNGLIEAFEPHSSFRTIRAAVAGSPVGLVARGGRLGFFDFAARVVTFVVTDGERSQRFEFEYRKTSAALSPDGTRVAIGEEDGSVRVLPVELR